MAGKRVSITKSQRETEVAKELISLCLEIADDGVLSGEEISRLAFWLRDNKDADLPAVAYLIEPIKRIIATGKATRNDRQELYMAIEAILPRDIRQQVTARRKELAEAKREQERRTKEELKEIARKEREQAHQEFIAQQSQVKTGGLYHFEERIAGVSYRNDDGTSRQDILQKTPLDSLVILQHVENPYDPHAIAAFNEKRKQLGYIPAETAGEIFYELQAGVRFVAFLKSMGYAQAVPLLGCHIVIIAIPPEVSSEIIDAYMSENGLVHYFAGLNARQNKGCLFAPFTTRR